MSARRNPLRYIDAGDLPLAILCYAITALPLITAIAWSRAA